MMGGRDVAKSFGVSSFCEQVPALLPRRGARLSRLTALVSRTVRIGAPALLCSQETAL
jgi:hypothetical protein